MFETKKYSNNYNNDLQKVLYSVLLLIKEFQKNYISV